MSSDRKYAVVTMERSAADPVARSAPALWAAEELKRALAERGVAVGEDDGGAGDGEVGGDPGRAEVRGGAETGVGSSGGVGYGAAGASGTEAEGVRFLIRLYGAADPAARILVEGAGLGEVADAESFAFVRERAGGEDRLSVVGADARGLAYALLELADRVRCADDPRAALDAVETGAERPRAPLRSVTRLFVSEVEDKAWFYDRAFWDEYLTMLATHRFNRFALALGIGYDSGHDPGVVDNYFCFAYPFLIDVPGYGVRAEGLPAEERERNLETLRYIGEQAKRRGLHFQLGLWTHSFAFPDSPDLAYRIEGVTPDNHALYCRDALRALLAACPAIDGVTLRVHYESGIPEPAFDFWRVVMDGAERDGRRVEIDLHAKGVEHPLIDAAVATGSPILVSCKYWAEHLGLPYHQADIRATEKADPDRRTLGFDAVTAASRRFTRYGYGDFLKSERDYDVIYRVWPGTQRLLLWGDPAMAAAYGRFGTFGGARGVEWFEPMSFKARKGSGSPGGRDPYADEALRLGGAEWKKYAYTYRLWGRLAYDPDASPDQWRRQLRAEFGDAASACEAALAHASRILPLVTTAHCPSAANNMYWPEMYPNQPIVVSDASNPYGFDSPAPHTYEASSPLDPELFASIGEYVERALRGESSGKIGPPETAGKLEALAAAAARHAAEADALASEAVAASPAYRRLRADVDIVAALGRFFAAKLRAGVVFAAYRRTGDGAALAAALAHYRAARAVWTEAADAARVYAADVTFGIKPYARGHWRDRLADIDRDIAAMERLLAAAGENEAAAAAASGSGAPANASGASAAGETASISAHGASTADPALPPLAVETLLAPAAAPSPVWRHVAPGGFARGRALPLAVEAPNAPADLNVRLRYRRVNQAEYYREAVMARDGDTFRAEIPADVADGVYPIAYYFEASDGRGRAWLWPGLDETLCNQPYFMAWPAGEGVRR